MIVERIRRRRRLRARKGESTHIASRERRVSESDVAASNRCARRRARARTPVLYTRARTVDKMECNTCFPLFFLGVGCWVFDKKEMRTYYMRIVCVHTTRTQWKASSYTGSHSIATCAFCAFGVAPPKTLLYLALMASGRNFRLFKEGKNMAKRSFARRRPTSASSRRCLEGVQNKADAP